MGEGSVRRLEESPAGGPAMLLSKKYVRTYVATGRRRTRHTSYRHMSQAFFASSVRRAQTKHKQQPARFANSSFKDVRGRRHVALARAQARDEGSSKATSKRQHHTIFHHHPPIRY